MPHSGTVSFLSYWRGLQESADQAPLREQFDPAQLKRLVPQMMMVSVVEADFPFRLSGGFIATAHGRELKDEPFVGLFREPFQAPLKTALQSALRRQQPLILKVETQWIPRRQADNLASQSETVKIEICLCPLSGPDGRVDRMVGIYQTLTAAPRSTTGKLGDFTLLSARLHEPQQTVRAAHLQLISLEGRRIA